MWFQTKWTQLQFEFLRFYCRFVRRNLLFCPSAISTPSTPSPTFLSPLYRRVIRIKHCKVKQVKTNLWRWISLFYWYCAVYFIPNHYLCDSFRTTRIGNCKKMNSKVYGAIAPKSNQTKQREQCDFAFRKIALHYFFNRFLYYFFNRFLNPRLISSHNVFQMSWNRILWHGNDDKLYDSVVTADIFVSCRQSRQILMLLDIK